MLCGIYKIENLINKKCYIGQSINIQRRWNIHKTDSRKPKYPLYLAFKKYGIENFSFEVLEECLEEELNEKEIFWISKFDSYFNGYNQTLGGNKHSCNVKISDSNLFLIIKLLQNSDITQREIAKQFNVGEDTISEINMGRTRICSGINYPIRIFKKQTFCSVCGVPITRCSETCVICLGQKNRIVERPTKEELYKLLKKNNFSAVGRMFGVSDNAIRKWCISYGIPSKAKDYKEPTPLKNKLIIKPIDQYSLNEIFLKSFNSVPEAANYLIKNNNIQANQNSIEGNIYRVAKGERKTAYKYIWKYK